MAAGGGRGFLVLRGGLVLLLRCLLVAALAVTAVVVRCAAAVVVAAAEHFHFVGDDVVCGAFDAVFALVFTALDAAFQIHLAAFFQVLSGDFGEKMDTLLGRSRR